MRGPLDWDLDTHGITLDIQGQGQDLRATYLPGVAVEAGFSKEETLVHLAQKAGYQGDFSDVIASTEFQRYQSVKFGKTYEEWSQ